VRVIAATHQNLEERVREGLFREDLYHRLNVIRLRLPSLRERREDIPVLARHFLAQSARQLGVEAKRMSEHAMQFLASLDLPGNVRQLENLCNRITVKAPGHTVEIKDLPPELLGSAGAPPAMPAAEPMTAVSPTAFNGHAVAAPFDRPLPVTMPRENGASMMVGTPVAKSSWIMMLEAEAAQMLSAGQPEVMDALGRQFESALIKTALRHTHGRKNDAAIRLGIGRNTITRKIQELGIEGGKDD
jgi:two-component system nitrogen regulation response regulator GlnG